MRHRDQFTGTLDESRRLGASANLGSPVAMWLTSDNRLFITTATPGGFRISEVTDWQTNAFRRVAVTTTPVAAGAGDGASCPNAPSPFGIAAINDDFTGTPIIATDGGAVGNIWSNDLYNSSPLDHTTVTTSLTDAGGLTGATIGTDGSVTVPGGFAAGQYTLRYSICDVSDPTVCSEASITVLLTATSGSTPDPGLAATGAEVPWWVYGGAGFLIITGLTLTLSARRRRHLARLH